jgi:hypothetical protein
MSAPKLVGLLILLAMLATVSYFAKCTGVFANTKVAQPAANCRMLEREMQDMGQVGPRR